MQTLTIILTVLDVLVAIALIVIVIMQEGNQKGLGAISGGADTFYGKNKGRSTDVLLKKVTTMLAVAFMVLSLILNFLVNA